jgi:hypothetical protein
MRSADHPGLAAMHFLRTMDTVYEVRTLTKLRDRIANDAEMLAFHEGRSSTLPGYYRRMLKQRLGPYAELFGEEDLTPHLEPSGGTDHKEPARRPPAVRTAPAEAAHGMALQP